MWVAKKRILVQRGKSGHVWLKPGDPVPEAETWPTQKAAVKQGEISWVDDNPLTFASNRPLVIVEELPDTDFGDETETKINSDDVSKSKSTKRKRNSTSTKKRNGK